MDASSHSLISSTRAEADHDSDHDPDHDSDHDPDHDPRPETRNNAEEFDIDEGGESERVCVCVVCKCMCIGGSARLIAVHSSNVRPRPPHSLS